MRDRHSMQTELTWTLLEEGKGLGEGRKKREGGRECRMTSWKERERERQGRRIQREKEEEEEEREVSKVSPLRAGVLPVLHSGVTQG